MCTLICVCGGLWENVGGTEEEICGMEIYIYIKIREEIIRD